MPFQYFWQGESIEASITRCLQKPLRCGWEGAGGTLPALAAWADLPYPALANTAAPMHSHNPWISAPKRGWGVSQSFCWSLTENEGVSEVPVLSFCGPITEEVALREALGTTTAPGLC